MRDSSQYKGAGQDGSEVSKAIQKITRKDGQVLFTVKIGNFQELRDCYGHIVAFELPSEVVNCLESAGGCLYATCVNRPKEGLTRPRIVTAVFSSYA